MSTSKLSISTVASIAAIIMAGVALSYSMGNRAGTNRPTVGFIDFQALLQQSDAGKSIRDQVEPRRAKLQKAAEAKLKEFKQEQEDIKKSGDDKSPEALANLQKKIDAWNAQAQREQAIIDAAANPAIQQVDQALRAQVEALAEENKLTAVLPMQSAFYVSKSQDMTSDAIRRLNKVLTKVDVKFEADKSADKPSDPDSEKKADKKAD